MVTWLRPGTKRDSYDTNDRHGKRHHHAFFQYSSYYENYPPPLVGGYQFNLGGGRLDLCDGDVAAKLAVAGSGLVDFWNRQRPFLYRGISQRYLFSSDNQKNIWR